jgi:hypothetical protein
MGIEQIVNVQISRETTAVSRAGFGVPMFLHEHSEFAERIRYYTSLSAVEADFVAGTEAYKAAQAAFGQEFAPTRFAVGRRDVAEDADVALAAIQQENDDWYCILSESRVVADILAIAAWTEAQRKIYIACSEDADVLTAVGTDIASQLKDLNYARTAFLWSDDQDLYPEAAWAGLMLTFDADAPNGHPTWAFKTLAGISADNHTDTEITNLKSKNANYYVEIGGVDITLDGKMAVGEWIDIIRGVDWLQARLEERVYSKLVNLPKIPYTDPGLAIIEAEIRAQLDAAITVGYIAADPEYTVTIPLVADISANDKALRTVTGIQFKATVSGAVHIVNIQGTVTV